jgi:hypothetical protein
VFLGSYAVTVRARTAGGTSPGVVVRAVAGPPGRPFTADFRLSRTDPVNPCIDVPTCNGAIRQDATHNSAQLGRLPQGTTVPGYCVRSGQNIRNDLAQGSTIWILIRYGAITGFVSTIWLGGPDAYQGLPQCPASYTPG